MMLAPGVRYAVDHIILLEKCELYGLRGSLLRSNLENRKQYVCYNNSLSDTRTV